MAAIRERLAAAVAAVPGVRVWPSAATFFLLQVRDVPAMRQGLAARGIAVRSCHSFPGLTADHLRVAVRDRADNQRLLDALGEVLGCQEDLRKSWSAGSHTQDWLPITGPCWSHSPHHPSQGRRS